MLFLFLPFFVEKKVAKKATQKRSFAVSAVHDPMSQLHIDFKARGSCLLS